MDTVPQYSLGFQQSNAEHRKQLHLMATYAHDKKVRSSAKQQLHPTVVYLSPLEERSFPAYSYETTSVSCMKGDCKKVYFIEQPQRARKNIFGL